MKKEKAVKLKMRQRKAVALTTEGRILQREPRAGGERAMVQVKTKN